jgi:acetylornithine/N-succinyldiaminopimelate aminotransferase
MERSEQLVAGLEVLSAQHGLGEVRGEGLLIALDIAPLDAPALVRAAFDAGLLLNAPRLHTLRFMPALNVSASEVDEMLSLLGGLLERSHR